ncbi:hypothetical protein Tco_0019342 [Tanacetum coccineum]
MIKYEYLHDDGDVFVDYSWEKALSIYGDVYLEWCLEFFSMMYFDRGVDRTKLMTEKYIWFRFCGVEKVLTLPEYAVLLGLYKEDELNHRLFAIHFTRTSLIKEPLMRIVHKLLVGSLLHRAGSKERCQKRDIWTMSALEESRGINLAWVISEHICKHALGRKENSLICGGHYVTKIAHSLGYLNDKEVAKCSELIECKTWTDKMLARRQSQKPRGLDSSWGDWNASLNKIERRADQSNFSYPAYEPSNVLLYSYPYVPYPYLYTHYPDTGSPSFGGNHYGAHGDSYHAGSIVPSSSYEIGGLSVGFHRDDFDPIVHSEDCVES